MTTPYPPPPPIPVQPLSYTPTSSSARPGILTAVAILSICIGSLGLVVNGLSSLWGLAMTAASSFSPPTTATVATTAPTPDSPTEDLPADDGMSAPDRAITVQTLSSLRPLTDQRQRHLDALLQQAGHKILPLTGPTLTRHSIAANVTDQGTFPSGSNKPSAGADYFVFARGRVDLTDRQALFHPSGKGETIRATATDENTDPTSAPTTQPPTAGTQRVPGPLTNLEMTNLIATLQSRTKTTLTPAQLSTLRAQLQSSSQTLFTPGTPVAAQLTAVNNASGTLTFSTPSGYLSVTPTGGLSTMSGFATGMTSFPNIRLQATLVVASSALSLCLAILLLIAGILTIRNSPTARRLHLIYAWLKIPLELAGVAAWAWFWSVLMNRFSSATASPAVAGISWFFICAAIFTLLYPIALLITLNTRPIKNFYSPVL